MNKFRAPHLRQPEPQPSPPRARAALAVRGRGALCSGSCSPAPALARRGHGAWCALRVRSVCCFVSFGPVPLYLLHLVLPAWFFFFPQITAAFFPQKHLKMGLVWGRRWPVYTLPDRLSDKVKKNKAFSSSQRSHYSHMEMAARRREPHNLQNIFFF